MRTTFHWRCRCAAPSIPTHLSAAIVDVVTRHESLRTVFPQIGDNATQKVLGLGEGIAGLESIDVERGSLEGVIFEFSSAGFDLVRETPGALPADHCRRREGRR